MEQQLCIFLHSNYSDHSNKFMNTLDSIPPHILSNVKLMPVCIDNVKIRKRILKSNAAIKTVPSILSVYPDGGAELIEGGNACVEWLQRQIDKYAQPQESFQQPTQQPTQQLPQQPTQQLTQQPTDHKQRHNLPKPPVSRPVQIDDDEDIDEQAPVNSVTSMDELEDEDEDENEDEDEDITRHRPPVRVRSDSGNYEEIEIPAQDEFDSRLVKRGIKSKGHSKVKLSELADEMRKNRDIDDTEMRPKNAPNDFMS
jgi:hypothetical protein